MDLWYVWDGIPEVANSNVTAPATAHSQREHEPMSHRPRPTFNPDFTVPYHVHLVLENDDGSWAPVCPVCEGNQIDPTGHWCTTCKGEGHIIDPADKLYEEA